MLKFSKGSAGGPRARQVCCRETFDMESGALLAREFFNPEKGQTRLPTPALPDCSPLSAQTLSVRSVFWYSEEEPVPESIRRVVAACQKRVCAPSQWSLSGGRRPGEDGFAQSREDDVHDVQMPVSGGATRSGGALLRFRSSLYHPKMA